jgi:hypothetical protein
MARKLAGSFLARLRSAGVEFTMAEDRVFSADLKKTKIRAAARLRQHRSGVVRWRDEGVTAGSGLQVLSRGETLA